MNFIHEDYISDSSICDEIIKDFHKKENLQRPGRLGIKGKLITDHTSKHSTDITLDQNEKIFESWLVEFQVILDRYLILFGFANYVAPFNIVEPINIQYYKPYEGYRAIHCERTGYNLRTTSRHLAFQTYLNTVDDGGETEFVYQQYKCKAVKGKTLIWPADWTHSHRGIVSSTESKYIITGWCSFKSGLVYESI